MTFSLTAAAAEALSVLLQKGIFAEETEGNLDAAIKIYEGIVKEGEANRSLVAQAQYRLGVCQLKKGQKDQAATAFRKIAEEFPGETELAGKARARLAELGQPTASVAVRQVWSKTGDAEPSRISPSGEILSFLDWKTGDLWLRNLKAGSNRKLTNARGWINSAEHATYSAFSPDGKRIAYDWWNKTNDSYELRLITLDDPTPKVILSHTNRWLFVGDWSPDNKTIAVVDWKRENREAKEWKGWLSLISVNDGSERKVASLEATDATSLRFSPDGRYLAYNFQRQGSGRGTLTTNDIFAVDVQSGSQKLVVEYLANDQFIGWAPRGSDILFTSERNGTTGLWSILVENGEAEQLPKLLKADLGNIRPIGITRDGAFFYSSQAADWATLYEAAIDVTTGKLLSPLKAIPTRLTVSKSASGKRLSPDGRFLAFSHSRGSKWSFHLEDLRTGQLREIPIWARAIGFTQDGRRTVSSFLFLDTVMTLGMGFFSSTGSRAR